MDDRYRQYARLAVTHSLQVRRGERVLIQTDSVSAAFAEVVGQEVIRAGAHPVFWFTSSRVAGVRLQEGDDEQVTFIPPTDLALAECECRVAINAPTGFRLPKCDPEVVIRRRRATAEVYDPLHTKQRWVYMLLPTRYLARRLGVSFQACKSLIFESTIGVDWEELAARGQAIEALFEGGSEVRIKAEGTDIRFSIAGRHSKNCVGMRNLPDGEVFWSPLEHTVEGVVTFQDPQFNNLGLVKNMRLAFLNGKVVEATATEGTSVLRSILDTDAGSRYLGEFGIGVNPLVRRMTGNILLDEKIAGTVHLALGDSYPETGGTNRSAIHWDMILDLRRGGEVYLDGRLVCLDGEWLTSAAAPSTGRLLSV